VVVVDGAVVLDVLAALVLVDAAEPLPSSPQAAITTRTPTRKGGRRRIGVSP
jgi:hypothetical protein